MVMRVSSAVADAFDLLGLPARFDLTAEAVRAAYLGKIQEEHPDTDVKAPSSAAAKPAAPSPAEPGEGGAAALNAAKVALLDAEARANILLARFGGPSKEQSRELPEGFLMSVMEAREGLEEASSRRDGAAIERWREWAERERDGHVTRVGRLFAGPGVRDDGAALAAIRRELNAWRYIERMLEQVEGL